MDKNKGTAARLTLVSISKVTMEHVEEEDLTYTLVRRSGNLLPKREVCPFPDQQMTV